jgi:2-keto-4-pentenoate hydratase/2-oxohepta-3-ene-1,7-dioic acid hydratase in catechol pathway
MRIVRFDGPSGGRYGLVEEEGVIPLEAAPWNTGGLPVPAGDPIPRKGIRLLPPTEPTKILAIGRNYRAHAEELGHEVPKEPLMFLKANSSLLAHGGTILLPRESERVDYEGELVLVVGKRARRIPAHAWREFLFGLTIAVDVTARDLQKTDGQWSRSKGFDTFCPVGPAILTGVDPADLQIETIVNGVRCQASRTSKMIFDAGTLISHLSQAMTLEPGDIILTGTPEGVGPLAAGDRVEVRVEKIGSLSASVAAEG